MPLPRRPLLAAAAGAGGTSASSMVFARLRPCGAAPAVRGNRPIRGAAESWQMRFSCCKSPPDRRLCHHRSAQLLTPSRYQLQANSNELTDTSRPSGMGRVFQLLERPATRGLGDHQLQRYQKVVSDSPATCTQNLHFPQLSRARTVLYAYIYRRSNPLPLPRANAGLHSIPLRNSVIGNHRKILARL